MEQIVKIFVQHSYYIENDLIVDYNVEPKVMLTKRFMLFIVTNIIFRPK